MKNPDFGTRSEELELMDDLSLSEPALAQNLEEIEVINRLLGGNKVVLNALDKMHWDSSDPDKVWEIADLGTGGGDLPRSISKWAKKRGRKVRIVGYDANPFMVEFSRKKAQGFPDIEFEVADVFSPEFKNRKFDIGLCSLFCHHFSDEELTELFQGLQKQCALGFVINDIHRHPVAYYTIKWLTKLFRGSYLVQNDAPLSVLRAFKREELVKLLADARIRSYDLCWKWAFRYQIIGWRP